MRQLDGEEARSRWMMRAMEWNEPRAKYPNIWAAGMPRRLMVTERAARRLRLGDLIATFYPASKLYPERSERCVGLSRVAGLECAEPQERCWITLETEHRFDPPLALERAPRFVLLCCDVGWPDCDTGLFDEIEAAAEAAGYRPAARPPASVPRPAAVVTAEPVGHAAAPPPVAPATTIVTTTEETSSRRRRFGGVDYSGDMRDPRESTWLAIVETVGEKLKVTHLAATGRSGLQHTLRSPGRELEDVEAIGLDFPFGLPLPFAECLVGKPLATGDWWTVAKRMETLSRPDYLSALESFRAGAGEIKRVTDERHRAFSPLHRVNPDLGPMTYHGMRMIGEDRSRFALRPFESAQGRLLMEVYPGAVVRKLDLAGAKGKRRPRAIAEALRTLPEYPVVFDGETLAACAGCRDAVDAVVAARCTAIAVLSGEVDRSPEELAPGHGARVRLEGWIYGLAC